MFSIDNYPFFVMNHGNWDIYRNKSGTCVAIPNENGKAAGSLPSFFGRLEWVKDKFKIQ